ncbi:MAG: hypothetical protein ACOX52_17390 [Verrucomicrobiota bacterium]
MLYRAGIDPDPDFDFDRTDRIHCLEAMREGACLFGGFSPTFAIRADFCCK